ncbi:MAG: FtsQ-type POTRA domain-containing protein [Nostocaceae cyanobacterium]|nr:FtsQ-type POTRA domain-containing protein [Nostocaceae cyanobacterium]
MAGLLSVSRTNLVERRRKLRRRRQIKNLQLVWRTIAVSSFAGGLLWMATQPMWVLKTPKEIEIDGNKLLSKQSVQSLVELSYPRFLLRIEPSEIAKSLKQQPTIEQANVRRRLFPPGLIVKVKERVPVAVAQTSTQEDRDTKDKAKTTGLLDATGLWIPLEKYTSDNPNFQLPNLKVIGIRENYFPVFSQLYQAMSKSPVQVMEIDFGDPTNLILTTELGKIHLGSPSSSQLLEQIQVISQMRYLPRKLNVNQIEYIDLKNPESPLVQMTQKKSVLPSQNP